MAKFFLDFGYEPRDELRFPAKKLRALWFSPPSVPLPDGGSGINGPLPRIFISELLVDQMSTQTQVCPKDHSWQIENLNFAPWLQAIRQWFPRIVCFFFDWKLDLQANDENCWYLLSCWVFLGHTLAQSCWYLLSIRRAWRKSWQVEYKNTPIFHKIYWYQYFRWELTCLHLIWDLTFQFLTIEWTWNSYNILFVLKIVVPSISYYFSCSLSSCV